MVGLSATKPNLDLREKTSPKPTHAHVGAGLGLSYSVHILNWSESYVVRISLSAEKLQSDFAPSHRHQRARALGLQSVRQVFGRLPGGLCHGPASQPSHQAGTTIQEVCFFDQRASQVCKP